MRVVIVTDIVSPHQMPLARCVAELAGPGNFRYVATERKQADRMILGWPDQGQPGWVLQPGVKVTEQEASVEWQQTSDILLSGHRQFDLFDTRCAGGLLTLYMSERWFKPPFGMARLLHPRYFRMALRFARLLKSPNFYYLPMGVHAATDAYRMARLFSGDLRCLFRAPDIAPVTCETLSPFVQTKIAQSASLKKGLKNNDVLSKIRIWAYFVAPSDSANPPLPNPKTPIHAFTHSRTKTFLNILWVGRMLGLKRVDTLIKAVGVLLEEGRNVRLKLVGHGPEEQNLKKLAETINNRQAAICLGSTNELPPITFSPPVPIVEVRGLMREADVYVLPSNGYEGWGAVVNEAMLEGCCIVASRESGAGATLIRSNETGLLFSSGDVDALAHLLRQVEADEALRMRLTTAGQRNMLDQWTPQVAAARLIAFAEALLKGSEPPSWATGPMSRC